MLEVVKNRYFRLRPWGVFGLALVVWGNSVSAQGISGTIRNGSVWSNLVAQLAPPPGDGSGTGQIMVCVKAGDATIAVLPPVTNGALPFAVTCPYSFGGPFLDGAYTVIAWVDGDFNGELDFGEPKGSVDVSIRLGAPVIGKRITITDDYDKDGLPDWWEAHWFQNDEDPLAFKGDSDPDGDGLSNLEEYRFASDGYGFNYLSPANWDTDGDGMDDGWECRYFNPELITGMDPVAINDDEDFDGDGLSNWQEYCGVDGYPRMVFDRVVDSVTKGKLSPLAAVSDDLSPVDIDTDFDMLLDSFEAAWYDPANRLDPHAGILTEVPDLGVFVDTAIAREDSDQDGLSNFREQCLLGQLHQSTTNSWLWDWSERVPFVQSTYNFQNKAYRICTMELCGGEALTLNLVMNRNIPASTNRFMLRNHEWTDPTEGTGYLYVGEDIPPGHDTDEDGLPDGWEVQFNLQPRDDGFDGSWVHGPFGDPDSDGLMNIEEYYGQDGERSVTRSYINGNGDETNPFEYNWRPDSTYQWRWFNSTAGFGDSAVEIGDAGVGTGISRKQTLGSALPTISLGQDLGTDSDDDGIIDSNEINPPIGVIPSSPVDSCDPFNLRSALIRSTNGLPIPDVELVASNLFHDVGVRPDLERRDWTLECQVKLLGTNLNGDLFNFETIFGGRNCVVYQLAVSNNAPVLIAHNTSTNLFTVSGKSLPTNQWVHLAAVWDHLNNSLTLYIDGVLAMAPQPMDESMSKYMFPSASKLALAVSPDGSFIGRLMIDEVRIWGLARSATQISEYAHQLVPAVNGDDVWIAGTENDTVLVNGGGIFEREPGIPLSNVYTKAGTYWLDDGDRKYDAAKDTLLVRGSNLVSGMTGTLESEVFWNDKDNSGNFTRNCLLAYYRFDDGGSSAEDFARRAKNGLTGVATEEFRFGDRGYALSTNYFSWVSNDAALVYGVDKRGADDSDHDGLPDGWEIVNGLDPWDDGTWQETSLGSKDGPNGPKGDRDDDRLNNLYEFWAGTNPRAEDSTGDGILDTQEDRDGDGVVNITEQLLGSRPDIVDTDDDGSADNEEQGTGTSLANAVDPAISRAVALAGSSGDYLNVPANNNQRLKEWTIESWVWPSNVVVGAGVIVRRVIENLAGGTQAVNYVMGLESNGVGGLQLYAGYVWPNGTQYIVRAGTIMPGTWTHLAASYSRLNATLTLYTNGAVVASTNTFYLEPPVSGRGGDTFVRIGEGFGGAIDEVRLWNKVRTATQIQLNTNRVIAASDTNGLINYFRFDDGEAITNSLNPAWTEFHQPAGFQDFMYANDWNQQWRHAAIKHGNVGLREGAIIPPPSLRVILQPEDALSVGAQWSIDGGSWQNSGDSVQGLSAGTHLVIYKEVPGWTQPATETISLTNGIATTFTRVYVQKSALVIRFNNLPLPPLAAWQVNGGDWYTNGVTVTNLNAGANVISYRSSPGYFEPPLETVTLIPGQTIELLREYTIMTANISAVILPTSASVAGASWRVDGGAWQPSGAVVGGLALATHQIQFSDLTRWITPSSVNITPTNQVVLVVTGLYSQVAGLAVDLLPIEAVATGAQWRVSGRDWTNSGTLLPLPLGSYTVEFKPVSGGWLAPGSQTAEVTDQHVTELSVSYYKADVFGGTGSTNAGDFWLPQGLDSDPLHRLYVADTEHHRVQMYDPLSQQWTIWGGVVAGTNLGKFNMPSGLAVDRLGNLYVADQNNHRIQKRSATNGQWTVVGSNTFISGVAVFGAALGQFHSPADVAVDSSLNLYVADTWNHRVQKLSTSGVWSVFVTNGTLAGRVQYPQGLHVDGDDNLFVSDDGVQTNGLNRVQKFSKIGQYLALLGGRDSVQGNLQDPSGMTIGNGNLYVANVYDSRVAYSDMTGLTWTTLVGSNVLSHPGDVEWDSRGFIYIADTSHNRILMVQVDPAAATNGLTQLTAMTSTGTNTSFTLAWFARLNWNYAVQYANSLTPGMVWVNLPGYSAVKGLDMITNCTDSTVLGITNRFYRIMAY
jgi:hypothetical protein